MNPSAITSAVLPPAMAVDRRPPRCVMELRGEDLDPFTGLPLHDTAGRVLGQRTPALVPDLCSVIVLGVSGLAVPTAIRELMRA